MVLNEYGLKVKISAAAKFWTGITAVRVASKIQNTAAADFWILNLDVKEVLVVAT